MGDRVRRLVEAACRYRVLIWLAVALAGLDRVVAAQARRWDAYDPHPYRERLARCREGRWDLLVVGGSPAMCGIDPAILAGAPWRGEPARIGLQFRACRLPLRPRSGCGRARAAERRRGCWFTGRRPPISTTAAVEESGPRRNDDPGRSGSGCRRPAQVEPDGMPGTSAASVPPGPGNFTTTAEASASAWPKPQSRIWPGHVRRKRPRPGTASSSVTCEPATASPRIRR